MNIELTIDAIHSPGIEKDQGDEYVDRALLGEPETELEAADSYRVQFFDEENPESIRTDKPDSEANADKAKIGSPISHTIVAIHSVLEARSCCRSPM
jgi:hypothetical protein